MSLRYKGAILSTVGPTAAASGQWTAKQQMQMQGAGVWPMPPDAPTIGTATAGVSSASVGFTAPSYTGYPAGVTSYTVTSSPDGITGTGASSPITVSGLTNGTAYTFTVTATNATGTGPASAASNSVTPEEANYIEEVFSTYLYTGNGSTQTITNGIDLATKGGMVWLKPRSESYSHKVYDTVRGINSRLFTNTTDAAGSGYLTSFNSDGFSKSYDLGENTNNQTYASWTFRKQPKFFDVVTYTGNGTAGRTISHNLGSAPGFMVVKCTSTTGDWAVYHISLGASQTMQLNTTAVAAGPDYWNSTAPTSTVFSVGSNAAVNTSGATYVAYLFAHNAGGFGLTGTDSVISCGYYTGSTGVTEVNLGWEPQWVLMKSGNAEGQWSIEDTMRGMSYSGQEQLEPNSSAAASTQSAYVRPTANGFTVQPSYYGNGVAVIYVAIRRGPMKVPTDATKVFNPQWSSAANGTTLTTNFPVDLQMTQYRSGDYNYVMDRLRGVSSNSTASGPGLVTQGTNAEGSTGYSQGWSNTGFQIAFTGRYPFVYWNFKRAPSFMDVVCYTGDSTLGRAVPHNLGAAPELMIVKNRNNTENWVVYSAATGATKRLILNSTAASGVRAVWADTTPTATNFYVGGSDVLGETNYTTYTYVAYLFATCAGVSKVGNYTGTGATQTIDCGFAAGARFVLVKRTDSTGDWYVWDTARGMVSGTDPSLKWNTQDAEVNANSVYTTTGGFQIVSTAAGINASGGSFIFFAVA